MNWTFFFSIRFVFFAFLLSFLAMMIVHPDLLLFKRLSFLYANDTDLPLGSSFALISQFYHGGIQLWDRYDHLNFAYTQLSAGIYTLSNTITAAVYVFFSWLFKYPAEAMHHFHTIVWHGANMLIRTLGGFLLLRRFTQKPWVILLSLVYLNTLLTNAVYQALMTNNLYSYLPLLLFFILKFFDSFSLNDFLVMLVMGVIIVANSPLFALGYFYLVVHYFLIAILIFTWF